MEKNSTLIKKDAIQLIYAGGTFGCHGTPLEPLASYEFLPKLLEILTADGHSLSITNNELIKDSSHLSATDFFHFYRLILENYQQGYDNFVLITGTDTLSYLGSFLAECFAGSDINISLTASMKPLFLPDNKPLNVDEDGDAWNNLITAIQNCQNNNRGVHVCMSGNVWLAQSVQKLHSHNMDAFVGQSHSVNHDNSDNANNYQRLTELQKQQWLTNRFAVINTMQTQLVDSSVYPLYVVPNNISSLEQQLKYCLTTNGYDYLKPSAIILVGFGAGNIPHSITTEKLLDQAYQLGILVIATTQCSFGGVNSNYQAGSWQYKHHVVSGGKLTIEAIFAKALWLDLSHRTLAEKTQSWQNYLNKTHNNEHDNSNKQTN